ncbi:MAG: GNAT family N-acetyltransferase [Chitinivibrionales bacterium]|nr:GNAT family N-acetyltransferase [Chitinivibrionales bacterium]
MRNTHLVEVKTEASVQEEISYKPLAKEHLPGVADLLNRIFNSRFDAKVLEWKYFDNPAGKPISTVILAGAQVVGVLGSIPAKWVYKGTCVNAIKQVDLAIDQQYRRLDIYLQLVALNAIDLARYKAFFTYGIANKESIEVNKSFLLNVAVNKVPRHSRILNPLPYLKRMKIPSLLLPVLNTFGKLFLSMHYPSTARIPKGYTMETVTAFDKRFDSLWDRMKAEYDLALVRDADFLNWRYCRAPQMTYDIKIIQTRATGNIIGAIVLGLQEKPQRIGNIYDLLVPRDTPEKFTRALLCEAIQHFLRKKADKIRCWMYEHAHAYSTIKASGFFPRTDERCLNVSIDETRDDVPDISFFAKRENWYISLSDSDTAFEFEED